MMKKLSAFAKNYKLQIALAPAFKMFEAILELFVPLVVKKIIDVGIVSGDSNYIFYMCILLAVLALVGLAFSVTAQYFSAYAAVGIASSLRLSLFSHIGSLSYTVLLYLQAQYPFYP